MFTGFKPAGGGATPGSPSSIPEFLKAMPGMTDPSHIHVFQSASGRVADHIGLSSSFNEGATGLTYRRPAGDGSFRLLINASGSMLMTDNTRMDADSTDLGGVHRIFVPSATGVGTNYLFGKANSTVGYSTRINNTDGDLEFFWNPSAGGNQLLTVEADHRTGTEIVVCWAIDVTNSELRIVTSLGEVSTALVSGAGSNTVAFTLGFLSTVGSAKNNEYAFDALWDGYAPTIDELRTMVTVFA